MPFVKISICSFINILSKETAGIDNREAKFGRRKTCIAW